MYSLNYQVEDMCKDNSIKCHFSNNRVLINDSFWFDYCTNYEVNCIQFYIDIIKGKNEMINLIVGKLNTTIDAGCIFKAYEYYQGEDVCINESSIIIDINNISDKDDEYYTSYGKSIHFKVKINLSNPVMYYLVNWKNEKQILKIKTTTSLQYILDQLCNFTKLKCCKEDCIKMVNIRKGFPNQNDYCNDESTYMVSTSHGYRNKHSSFTTYYFCSVECMEHFKKYNYCSRCHEEGNGTYIDELGYTLCNGRGDFEPSCIAKYELEIKFRENYKDIKWFDEKTLNRLLHGCDELKKLISDNDNKLTKEMLLDLYNLRKYNGITEEQVEYISRLNFSETLDFILENI